MTTKSTRTIKDEVINSAKKYAKKKGRSLSQLVENYLKSIGSDPEESKEEIISPEMLKLMGVIKIADDADYKTALRNAPLKKYSS